MEGIIYCYASPSGKRYVGQTRDEVKRRACFMNSNRGYAGYLINRARKKYGPASFTYEVLERVESSNSLDLGMMLDEREMYWIARLDSFGPNGYNLNAGGGISNWAGSHHTPETKERIGASQRGSLSINWGTHHSDAHKQYLHDVLFGRLSRNLCVYDTDGTFLGEFDNSKEFSELFGCTGGAAVKCARGITLTTGGFIFLFSDETDKLLERLDLLSTRSDNDPKVVYCYSSSGDFLMEYLSVSSAASELGLARTYLSQLCSGVRYCKDVLFSYTQDEDTINLRLSRLGWSQKPHVVDVVMPDGTPLTFRSEKHASEELGLPISLVMRGCTGSVPVIMGYQFTPRAISFKLYSSSRTVLQCDSTGKVIGQFMSVKDACLQTGFSRIDISGSLGGHRPKVHGTFFVYGDSWDGVSTFEVPWTDKPAILCYQKDGVLVGRYSSIKEAANALGLRESCINFAVWGKRSQTGGYVFLRECDMNELDARLARANTTRSRDPRRRRVEVFAPDGTSLGVFESGAEVRKIPVLKHAHVTALCQGKEKHHKGYTMRYA